MKTFVQPYEIIKVEKARIVMPERQSQCLGDPGQQEALARSVGSDEKQRLLRRQGSQYDGFEIGKAYQSDVAE